MDQRIYLLNFFRDEGFIRKTCKKCNRKFWTLNEDQEYCGDSSCIEYQFIGKGLDSPLKTTCDVRNSFINFFAKRGHEVVKRYPVVARWREDVYLVGASIYDFQPWVTEGITPPPANPLVISQPCIRLTDLDNIGKTGRHLSSFEMMAHHAFNIGGKRVYWTEETVKLSYEFFTKAVKIPPEELTYIEDWWSGGGNAGEDFEVVVRGLELATLVFMHYKVFNSDKIIPMKNEIVDTGYGLERILWLIKGTPTVYDAIYGKLIDKVFNLIGGPPLNCKEYMALARFLGHIDSKKPETLREATRRISTLLNIPSDEVLSILETYENIYLILDHMKSVILMLNDGVVPSNAAVGYLARLLIRRIIRALMKLNLRISLIELADMVIAHIAPDFPEIKENEEVIKKILNLEEERYNKTLKRGRLTIEKIAYSLKEKGIRSMPQDTLIMLYDSHGLPPDYVKEIAEKYGISVEIPLDFYGALAQRHKGDKETKREEELDRLLEFIKDLPPTRTLYYEKPYDTQFEAKILRVIEGRYVILDQTLFYPEGGGAKADKGILVSDDSSCRVLDARKVNNVIIHICDSCPFKEGQIVKGIIDSERRKQIMRGHTATHVLLAAARKILGKHVWQAGASKDSDKCRLDITHFEKLSKEEIRKIELLANQIVLENRRVLSHVMLRTDAEKKYGFMLYQGGVIPGRYLRIVEVEGWDAEACGGLHVMHTGEIGLIKILKTERIQDGVERLEFSVGKAALEYVWNTEEKISKIAELLRTSRENVVEAVNNVVNRLNELETEAKKLLKARLIHEKEVLIGKSITVSSILRFIGQAYNNEDRRLLVNLASDIVKEHPDVFILLLNKRGEKLEYLGIAGRKVIEKGFNALKVNETILSMIKGKGGGRKDFIQGTGLYSGNPKEIISKVLNEIKRAFI